MTHYRLELEGDIPQEWAGWFNAAAVVRKEGRTEIEVEVPDDSALHGLLRRVQDLRLRLVSLTRIEPKT